MSSKLTLNIGYVNVRGLNDHTLQSITHLIRNNSYDLLILSETWFLNRNQYLNSSFFLAESSIPTNQPHGRRYNGGLLAFVSPYLKNIINIFFTSRHSLGVSFYNQKMGFVYYPPSLHHDEIQNDLEALGQVNMLVGDMNMRLGSISGDKIANERLRKHVINNFNSLFHLDYQRNHNNEIVSRTDHIFSDTNLKWTYQLNPPFSTDHGLMSIEFPSTASCLKSENHLSYRFDYTPFTNPYFRSYIREQFDASYAYYLMFESSKAHQYICCSMKLPNTTETQLIIDRTYDSLIETLHSLLDCNLQKYEAHGVKLKPDFKHKDASEPPKSVTSAIRNFKRSQRTKQRSNPIVSNNPSITPIEEATAHYRKLFDSSESCPTRERSNDLVFATTITTKQIKEAILWYPNHKSMGPDGLHTLVFKTLAKSPLFMTILTDLFHTYAASGLVPSSWSKCNLHLLVKDPTNPVSTNTRPIALSNILRRIFEKLLLKSWMTIDQPWIQLNNGQAGFRGGYSTLSHLILSDEISRRDNPFSIFLDIKAAFDSVSWSKLDDILKARDCPTVHRNIILSLICEPAELYLSVNQSERTTIHTKKGVFQGGGISAFVFAIYIDPLANKLNQSSPLHRPSALLYADDIQLKPRSVSHALSMLTICSNYALDLNFAWNLRKCAVVGHCDTILQLAGGPIPVSASYKYLGAVHKSNGIDWHETMQNSIDKQAKFLRMFENSNWHPRLRLIIYRTFIRPISEYTAAITWAWIQKDPKSRQSTLKLMKESHNRGIAFIFQRKKHSKLMDYMCGLGSFTYRMQCLFGSLTASLKRLKPCNPLLHARSVYMLSYSSNFILQICFQSPYYKEFKKSNEKQLVLWKTWKRQKLRNLRTQDAKLMSTIAYYCPHATNRDSSSLIFNESSTMFRLVTDWRLNVFLNHRTCHCSQLFTRRHVPCILGTMPTYLKIQSSLAFAKLTHFLQQIQSRSIHLNPLDLLLNLGNYISFSTLFGELATLLDS